MVICLTYSEGIVVKGGWAVRCNRGRGLGGRGGGGGLVKQNVLEGRAEHFVFTSWLKGALI